MWQRISGLRSKTLYILFVTACALIPFWKFPYIPPVVIFILLITALCSYLGKWQELGRIIIRWPAFIWLFILLFVYWVINFIFIAQIPLNIWYNPTFITEDGKIFFAYAPLFVVPLLYFWLRQKVAKGIAIIVAVSVIVTLFAIVQYYLEFKIPGLQARQQFVLFGSVAGKELLSGILQHNAAAAFLLFPALFTILKTYTARRKWPWMASSTILVLGIVLTESRSGVIGLSVAISVATCVIILKLWAVNWRKRFLYLIGSLIAVNLVLLCIALTFSSINNRFAQVETVATQKINQSKNPISTAEESESTVSASLKPQEQDKPGTISSEKILPPAAPLDNVNSRLFLWHKALNLSEVAPIFGVGTTRYNDIDYEISQVVPGVVVSSGGKIAHNDAHAHNSYLHILAETGILGLLLFIAFWAMVLWTIFKRTIRSTSSQARVFHLAMISSVCGLLVSALFEHNLAAPTIMFSYSFLLGFYAIQNDHDFGLDNKAEVSQKKNQNILWLDHRAAMGGGEKVLLNYLASSKKPKSQVRVITFENGDLVESLTKIGYKVKVLTPSSEFVSVGRNNARILSWFKQLKALVWLVGEVAKFIRKNDIGLVIGNSTKADLVGILAARITCRPMVVRLHDTLEIGEFNRKTFYLLKFMFVYGVDYFISVSRVVDQSLEKIGVPDFRRRVVYNGIRMPVNAKVSDSTSPISKFAGQKVVILSRLIRHKGQHVVVEIWPHILKKHPQAKLFLVGGGLFDNEGYEDYLRELVVKLKLQKSVIFTGFVDDVQAVLRDADLLIQPSLNPDPLPTAILEAVSNGVYVIASNSGGAKEIITESRLGSLYNSTDTATLQTLIEKALQQNPSKHRPPNNKEFTGRFSHQAYISNMDRVIDGVTKDDFESMNTSVYTEINNV